MMTMLKLSPAAREQVRLSIEQDGGDGVGLRVAANRSETGAIEYLLGLDAAREDDRSIDLQGVRVLLSPSDQALLSGAVMDYVEVEAGRKRFIFLNPNDPEYVAPTET